MTTEPIYAYKRGPPKPRAKRGTPEADLQRAVVAYLGYALPEPYFVYASLVGVNLGPHKGSEMKSLGVRPDMADLTIVNLDTGMSRFLELKSKTGSLSPGQRAMAARLGSKWVTVRTIEEVRDALVLWGVTPRVSIAQANRYGVGI